MNDFDVSLLHLIYQSLILIVYLLQKLKHKVKFRDGLIGIGLKVT
jgi:hypothetical protein